MEFLVTMTTQVPAGTSDDVVADVRRCEAAHSHDLAEQGLLLRLWRAPVEPGEWRTLDLFSGENGERLEKTLASMPLRVWRRDEVTPLAPHPNDPAPERRAPRAQLPEFFTVFTFRISQDASPDDVSAVTAREAVRAGNSRTRGRSCGCGSCRPRRDRPGAGLVAGRRSAADARHSGLTADVERDDGADDAVGGASERPC
jgi:muconolactone delta-isomerase